MSLGKREKDRGACRRRRRHRRRASWEVSDVGDIKSISAKILPLFFFFLFYLPPCLALLLPASSSSSCLSSPYNNNASLSLFLYKYRYSYIYILDLTGESATTTTYKRTQRNSSWTGGGKKWKEGGFLWWDNRFPPTLTLISWRYQWKRAKEGETLLLQEEEVVVMAVVECDFTFPTNRTADPDVVRLLNVSAQLRPCVQKRPSLSFSSTTLGCRCTTRERPRRCGQPQVAVVVRTL